MTRWVRGRPENLHCLRVPKSVILLGPPSQNTRARAQTTGTCCLPVLEAEVKTKVLAGLESRGLSPRPACLAAPLHGPPVPPYKDQSLFILLGGLWKAAVSNPSHSVRYGAENHSLTLCGNDYTLTSLPNSQRFVMTGMEPSFSICCGGSGSSLSPTSSLQSLSSLQSIN
jgi:hypothetical protein